MKLGRKRGSMILLSSKLFTVVTVFFIIVLLGTIQIIFFTTKLKASLRLVISERDFEDIFRSATTNTSTASRCGSALKWTSLEAGKDDKTGFLSAYFDDRKGLQNRPAVIVLGYHWKSLKDLELHCVLSFKNGSTLCSSTPVQGMACLILREKDKLANSHTYQCRINCDTSGCTESDIPVSVSMSVGSKCAKQSEAIPVQDCRPNTQDLVSKQKKIAVCPSTPLFKHGRQEIVEFIEMNKALGVDLVSLYITPSIDLKTIQYLKEQYVEDGMVEIFQWNIVDDVTPVYYYGQLLSMHDCMYRNMYRVDYIILEDLDELIVPLQHENYMDMIESLNTSAHSYRFKNHFFAVNTTKKPRLPNCGGMTLPKYFHRTDLLNCPYSYIHRSKYIIKPKYIRFLDIHGVCGHNTLPGEREYHVPTNISILGHYRYDFPRGKGECTDRNITKQRTLLKFQSKVTQSMCTFYM